MIDSAFELTSGAGVLLAVEAPHTGTLAERFDQVAELLAVLDLPEVGIDYDTSHVYRSGTSLEDSLRFVGERMVKVALRDVDSDGEFCRPGQGHVDFRRLLALLRANGYAGDLVLELETPGIVDGADERREIELARAYVEALLAGS
jgi:sugar phosphate isomerase/epimerase